MSVAEKINKLKTDISEAYNSVQYKNGILPQYKNTENLSVAILSIKSEEDLSTELTEQDNLITNQDGTIGDIINALEGRGAGIVPEGTLDITENGEYDVTNYEKANVSVTNVLNQYLGGNKTEITLEDLANVGAIRKYQFYYSLIKSIEIPSRTTQIGEYAFAQSQLASINMPNTVMTIHQGIFDTCSKLTSVVLSKTISSIPNNAFRQCRALTAIEIPNKVTSIGQSAFYDCRAITEIIIPESVTNIGIRAFAYCAGLTSVIISDKVTSIPDYAFYQCTALTAIEIPEKVTKIGARAFGLCTSLAEMICKPTTPPTIDSMSLSLSSAGYVIKVPAGSVEAYKSATNWSIHADHIVAYEEG